MSLPSKRKLGPVGNRHAKERAINAAGERRRLENVSDASYQRLEKSNPHLTRKHNDTLAFVTLRQPNLDTLLSQKSPPKLKSKSFPHLYTLDHKLTEHQLKFENTRSRKPFYFDTPSHLVSGCDSYKYEPDTVHGGHSNFLTTSLSFPVHMNKLVQENERDSKRYEDRSLANFHTRDLSKTLQEIKSSNDQDRFVSELKESRSPLNIISHQWGTIQDLERKPVTAPNTTRLPQFHKPIHRPKPPRDTSQEVHWARLPKPKLRLERTPYLDTRCIAQPIENSSLYASPDDRFTRKTAEQSTFLDDVYKTNVEATRRLAEAKVERRAEANRRIDEYVAATDDMLERRSMSRDRSLANQTIAFIESLHRRDRGRIFNNMQNVMNHGHSPFTDTAVL